MVKNEAKENKTKLMASASCFFIFQFFEKTFAFLISRLVEDVRNLKGLIILNNVFNVGCGVHLAPITFVIQYCFF